jgi:predicted nucleic acid-binding protein
MLVSFSTALLDTNIVDYAFKPRTKLITAEILREAARKHTLVMSEYLRFEIYRGLAMSRIQDVKALVSSFAAHPVTKEILDVAAALATSYTCDEQTKGQQDRFSDGDVILAATAFKHGFKIITANRKDFPAPYFDEVHTYVSLDTAKRPIPIYELKPDTAYFNAMLKVCYPKIERRAENRDRSPL